MLVAALLMPETLSLVNRNSAPKKQAPDEWVIFQPILDIRVRWRAGKVTLALAGALAMVFFINKENTRAIKWFATAIAGLDFLIAIPLWFMYKTDGAEFQFATVMEWIPSVGVQYIFGVDGFAVLLILLTTLLGLIAIYSSYTAITERQKEYYVFLLILQTGMLGVFCSLDFILFYVFWEVMLVPMYFLIGVWGGPRRLYAAIKFFLYTLVGSVLMLLGILALYFYNAGGLLGWVCHVISAITAHNYAKENPHR